MSVLHTKYKYNQAISNHSQSCLTYKSLFKIKYKIIPNNNFTLNTKKHIYKNNNCLFLNIKYYYIDNVIDHLSFHYYEKGIVISYYNI